jgi:hypothetical protein
MNDLNEMNLDALRVELAYRRALLQRHPEAMRYRARLPKRLRRRRPAGGSFTTS